MPVFNTCSDRWSWRSHPLFIVLTIAIGQFSDYFMFGMRVPLLPYLIRSHLDNVSEDEVQSRVASLLMSFSIAVLVTAVPAGWLADFPSVRNKLYLAGLGVLLWATVTFYTSENYAVMVLSRVLNGVSAALLYAAGFAMVADAVGPRDLGKALGTVRSIASAGSLVGPPLGGFVFAGWGFDGILNVSLVVLMVDLVMRVLMVERRGAVAGCGNGGGGQTETDPLLLKSTPYVPPRTLLPILSCLSDTQLAAALFLNFIQYIILGSYDATLSMETGERFDISPEKVGFVFLALAVPVLAMSALAGWAVDKHGPRVVAMIGYGTFVPILVSVSLLTSGYLFASSSSSSSSGLSLFCGLLCLQGGCLSLISTPAVVKAKRVVGEIVRDDPARFGTRGATGQLFGINSLVSSFGLIVGNSMSAALRREVGYAGMNLALAVCCALGAFMANALFEEDKEDKLSNVR